MNFIQIKHWQLIIVLNPKRSNESNRAGDSLYILYALTKSYMHHSKLKPVA